MDKYEKLIDKILKGHSDANEEVLNLQPKGSKAKPYQVRQVRNLIMRYKLKLEVKNDK